MEQLRQLFARWAGEPCLQSLALGAGGSSRRYFRMVGATHRCIGTIAENPRENEAFFAYTSHFRSKGMPVPELYAIADDRRHYLQQDLGDLTLYGFLHEKKRQGRGFDAEVLGLYRQALSDLAAMQQAGADMDFGVAFPRAAFDRRSIQWDLNYFKYHFLQATESPFDEELLQDDFDRLTDLLLSADCNYFLYRDFQGRNIMIGPDAEGNGLDVHGGAERRLYYIDYQGGRRGAAQYDVASLLYSAKSDVPEAIRTELLNHYLDVRGIEGASRREWTDHYRAYVLVRILQTLGAYGFRGLYQRKDYFLQSIPLALRNLRRIFEDAALPIALPELERIANGIAIQQSGGTDTKPPLGEPSTLTVTVQSFSYRQGLPDDPSGNGGGHIFDCRALPNPGRYDQYKPYTGLDAPVIEFLRRQPSVDLFLDHCQAIVEQSIDTYVQRRFSHLSVAFGCTGGQHRSVYCAQSLADRLTKAHPDVAIRVIHREQQQK